MSRGSPTPRPPPHCDGEGEQTLCSPLACLRERGVGGAVGIEGPHGRVGRAGLARETPRGGRGHVRYGFGDPTTFSTNHWPLSSYSFEMSGLPLIFTAPVLSLIVPVKIDSKFFSPDLNFATSAA